MMGSVPLQEELGRPFCLQVKDTVRRCLCARHTEVNLPAPRWWTSAPRPCGGVLAMGAPSPGCSVTQPELTETDKRGEHRHVERAPGP